MRACADFSFTPSIRSEVWLRSGSSKVFRDHLSSFADLGRSSPGCQHHLVASWGNAP